MKRSSRPWAIGVACGLSLGLAVATPAVIADTGQSTATQSTNATSTNTTSSNTTGNTTLTNTTSSNNTSSNNTSTNGTSSNTTTSNSTTGNSTSTNTTTSNTTTGNTTTNNTTSSGGQTSTTTQDLTSLGTLSVAVQGQADSLFAGQEQQYQGSLTGTTDWRGFSHQGARTITLTFQNPVDVTNLKIVAEQDTALGVYFPKDVEFDFKQGGKWYTAGSQSSAIPLSEQKVMTQTFSWSNSTGIETSAVRLTIPVDVWVFVNGFDVQGSTTTTGAKPSTLQPVSPPSPKIGPLNPVAANANGIRNMLLVETGANGQSGLWSEADFEPMVAYEDTSGTMTKPLFDTILFLPYGKVKDTVTGLTNYLNDLFKPGQQLSALNQAVVASNTALNRSGYHEKVVLSLPYFAYGTADFGKVNGTDLNFGGSDADPNALQAREQAEQWYLNQVISRWNKANFSNLELVGLYWDEEQYRDTKPGETQFIQFASNEAKSVNLPLFWIPFYGAGGVWDWKQLGFTATWIQPNYVEQGQSANLNRMTEATTAAATAGMGIEIELTGITPADQQLYDNSLAQLSADGFNENQASHAYYDGSKLLLTSAESTGSKRVAYNTTASFINGGNLNAAQ